MWFDKIMTRPCPFEIPCDSIKYRQDPVHMRFSVFFFFFNMSKFANDSRIYSWPKFFEFWRYMSKNTQFCCQAWKHFFLIFLWQNLIEKGVHLENSQEWIKKSPLTYTSQKRISGIVVANLLILKKKECKNFLNIRKFFW